MAILALKQYQNKDGLSERLTCPVSPFISVYVVPVRIESMSSNPITQRTAIAPKESRATGTMSFVETTIAIKLTMKSAPSKRNAQSDLLLRNLRRVDASSGFRGSGKYLNPINERVADNVQVIPAANKARRPNDGARKILNPEYSIDRDQPTSWASPLGINVLLCGAIGIICFVMIMLHAR